MLNINPVLLVTLVLFSGSYPAAAAEVTVMISGGFKAAMEKLIPQFEAQSGDSIRLISGPSMGASQEAIPARLRRGEQADVVIMVGEALNKLDKANWLQPHSRVELADSTIGMVVKSGDAQPAIKTAADLRSTLLQAQSIAYSDSASGRYISSHLFKKLGIEDRVRAKATMIERVPVASEVAKGMYSLGFQQVSELLPVPGVTFIGELPQDMQYVTRFAGAVTANARHAQEGKALLMYLSSASAQQTIRATGMKSVPSS